MENYQKIEKIGEGKTRLDFLLSSNYAQALMVLFTRLVIYKMVERLWHWRRFGLRLKMKVFQVQQFERSPSSKKWATRISCDSWTLYMLMATNSTWSSNSLIWISRNIWKLSLSQMEVEARLFPKVHKICRDLDWVKTWWRNSWHKWSKVSDIVTVIEFYIEIWNHKICWSIEMVTSNWLISVLQEHLEFLWEHIHMKWVE